MFTKVGTAIVDVLQVFVFAVALFLFMYLFLFQPHKIDGNSMVPNFFDREFLLTDKVSYRIGVPERGDVVVFAAPPDGSKEFIKRIIGLPGDSVALKDGRVFVGGKLLVESYLPEGTYTQGGGFLKEGEQVVVPEGEYFVLGDNRSHSYDSRAWGTISKSKITGRAWVVYWPISKSGTINSPSYNI